MKKRRKSKLDLTDQEKRILKQLRLAFRQVAGKADAGRIAKLTVLAFSREFPQRKGTQNVLANAYVRAIPTLRKALADEGGSVNAADAAKRLGVSRATVLRRYREKRLVGWRDYHGAEVRFPVWQFHNNGLLPGIEDVLAVFRRENYLGDIGTTLFFVSRYYSLDGQRPLDCLREGNVEDAVRTAHVHVS